MGKHLDFYYACSVTGKIPKDGLCNCAHSGYIDKNLLDLFEPIQRDSNLLDKRGQTTIYWGSGLLQDSVLSDKYFGFTSLRQTIVLFMAAMNNEL